MDLLNGFSWVEFEEYEMEESKKRGKLKRKDKKKGVWQNLLSFSLQKQQNYLCFWLIYHKNDHLDDQPSLFGLIFFLLSS